MTLLLLPVIAVTLISHASGQNLASCAKTVCGAGKECRIIKRCWSIDCQVGTMCVDPTMLPIDVSNHMCPYDHPLLTSHNGQFPTELKCGTVLVSSCPAGSYCVDPPGVCCTGNNKPAGVCPAHAQADFLSAQSGGKTCSQFCRHDQECSGFQRCCQTSPNCRTCVDPVSPNTCQSKICEPDFHCVMQETNSCPSYPCFAEPGCVPDRAGTCPSYLQSQPSCLQDQCSKDSHCRAGFKCCSSARGTCKVCVDPFAPPPLPPTLPPAPTNYLQPAINAPANTNPLDMGSFAGGPSPAASPSSSPYDAPGPPAGPAPSPGSASSPGTDSWSGMGSNTPTNTGGPKTPAANAWTDMTGGDNQAPNPWASVGTNPGPLNPGPLNPGAGATPTGTQTDPFSSLFGPGTASSAALDDALNGIQASATAAATAAAGGGDPGPTLARINNILGAQGGDRPGTSGTSGSNSSPLFVTAGGGLNPSGSLNSGPGPNVNTNPGGVNVNALQSGSLPTMTPGGAANPFANMMSALQRNPAAANMLNSLQQNMGPPSPAANNPFNNPNRGGASATMMQNLMASRNPMNNNNNPMNDNNNNNNNPMNTNPKTLTSNPFNRISNGLNPTAPLDPAGSNPLSSLGSKPLGSNPISLLSVGGGGGGKVQDMVNMLNPLARHPANVNPQAPFAAVSNPFSNMMANNPAAKAAIARQLQQQQTRGSLMQNLQQQRQQQQQQLQQQQQQQLLQQQQLRQQQQQKQQPTRPSRTKCDMRCMMTMLMMGS